MKTFLDRDFMLQNDTAKLLFHNYAEDMPILDYHCHLSAKEICENAPAYNLTELWLLGDHYKWRLMRANGVSEKYVTGNASDYEKFLAFAETLPYAVGNPVYHWSHLELQRYFGITEPLTPKTAPAIWEKTKEILSDGKHTPGYFISKSNVYAVCTTEDPVDTLEYHAKIREDGLLSCKVLPAFRPDNALAIHKPGWKAYLSRLGEVSGIEITDFESLKEALAVRMEAFKAAGCPASDHGFEKMPWNRVGEQEAARIFASALAGESLSEDEMDGYRTELMLWLGERYCENDWAMELHINAIRDCNTEAVRRIGEAAGFDNVCDHQVVRPVTYFMNALEKKGKLPKTILFSLNDADNLTMASIPGNFQDGIIPGKIQMGPAWWFQDHEDGMEKQLRALASVGLLGRFIGMLTDSRSFLSYPRHEYFRRILCNLLGEWVESGKFPYDEETLGMLVRRISFDNAKEYFGL